MVTLFIYSLRRKNFKISLRFRERERKEKELLIIIGIKPSDTPIFEIAIFVFLACFEFFVAITQVKKSEKEEKGINKLKY